MMATPIGIIELVATADRLCGIIIHPRSACVEIGTAPSDDVLVTAVTQLREYFSGKRRDFDLPILPARTMRGAVLRAAINSITYGETATYGQLARACDSSSRAMGQACARNPLPIIVACHRVTSSGNAPEHYSGGDGVSTKAWLTAHEARISGKTLL